LRHRVIVSPPRAGGGKSRRVVASGASGRSWSQKSVSSA
jgi:hypothetical protein